MVHRYPNLLQLLRVGWVSYARAEIFKSFTKSTQGKPLNIELKYIGAPGKGFVLLSVQSRD